VNDILSLIGLDRATLGVAALCALSGSFVLSRFARSLGALSYAVNFLTLLAGAVAASLALVHLGWHIEYSLERQLLASFAGMGVVAFVTLLLQARSPLNG
jgi:hypothetical protein